MDVISLYNPCKNDVDDRIVNLFLPSSVPGEPKDVRASPVNSSSVLVTWQPPADEDRNGVIRGYQIYVQPKNTVCNFLCHF